MKNILIIEDETDLREALQARFTSDGYQASTARTTEEGLAMVVKQKPDLILLDIITRTLHGAVFLERLRQLPPDKNDSKVIVLTNLDNEITREKVKPFGIEHFLVKADVTLDQIAETVTATLLN